MKSLTTAVLVTFLAGRAFAISNLYNCKESINNDKVIFAKLVVDDDNTNIFFAEADQSANSVAIADHFFEQVTSLKSGHHELGDSEKLSSYFKPQGIELNQIYLETADSNRHPNDVLYPFTNVYLSLVANGENFGLQTVEIRHFGHQGGKEDKLLTTGSQSFSCQFSSKQSSDGLSAKSRRVIAKNLSDVRDKFGIAALFTDHTKIVQVNTDMMKIIEKLQFGKISGSKINTAKLHWPGDTLKWPLHELVLIKESDQDIVYVFDINGNYLTYLLARHPSMG